MSVARHLITFVMFNLPAQNPAAMSQLIVALEEGVLNAVKASENAKMNQLASELFGSTDSDDEREVDACLGHNSGQSSRASFDRDVRMVDAWEASSEGSAAAGQDAGVVPAHDHESGIEDRASLQRATRRWSSGAAFCAGATGATLFVVMLFMLLMASGVVTVRDVLE